MLGLSGSPKKLVLQDPFRGFVGTLKGLSGFYRGRSLNPLYRAWGFPIRDIKKRLAYFPRDVIGV